VFIDPQWRDQLGEINLEEAQMLDMAPYFRSPLPLQTAHSHNLENALSHRVRSGLSCSCFTSYYFHVRF